LTCRPDKTSSPRQKCFAKGKFWRWGEKNGKRGKGGLGKGKNGQSQGINGGGRPGGMGSQKTTKRPGHGLTRMAKEEQVGILKDKGPHGNKGRKGRKQKMKREDQRA